MKTASIALVLACAGCGASGPSEVARPATWVDRSPHQVEQVRVADGVDLEVLDWGGTGPALVVLAGLGHTAHIYDHLAPALTDSFHVYGITRRGFGASSRPAAPYSVSILADDLLRVLDQLGVKSAVLVGHSFAGEELTWFAGHYPERVNRLVYLDAAYDRTDTAFDAIADQMPVAPEASAADHASLPAFCSFQAKSLQAPCPEADVRATTEFDAAGRFVKRRTPDEVVGAIFESVKPPDYSKVKAPTLALFTIAGSSAELAAWQEMAPENRAKAEKVFPRMREIRLGWQEQFRQQMPAARVVVMESVPHYLFLSHREEVLREMRAFLTPAPSE